MSTPPGGEFKFPASTRNRTNAELDRQLGFTRGTGSADDSDNAKEDDNLTSEMMVDGDTEQQRVISINVGGQLAREHANENPGS